MGAPQPGVQHGRLSKPVLVVERRGAPARPRLSRSVGGRRSCDGSPGLRAGADPQRARFRRFRETLVGPAAGDRGRPARTRRERLCQGCDELCSAHLCPGYRGAAGRSGDRPVRDDRHVAGRDRDDAAGGAGAGAAGGGADQRYRAGDRAGRAGADPQLCRQGVELADLAARGARGAGHASRHLPRLGAGTVAGNGQATVPAEFGGAGGARLRPAHRRAVSRAGGGDGAGHVVGAGRAGGIAGDGGAGCAIGPAGRGDRDADGGGAAGGRTGDGGRGGPCADAGGAGGGCGGRAAAGAAGLAPDAWYRRLPVADREGVQKLVRARRLRVRHSSAAIAAAISMAMPWRSSSAPWNGAVVNSCEIGRSSSGTGPA